MLLTSAVSNVFSFEAIGLYLERTATYHQPEDGHIELSFIIEKYIPSHSRLRSVTLCVAFLVYGRLSCILRVEQEGEGPCNVGALLSRLYGIGTLEGYLFVC